MTKTIWVLGGSGLVGQALRDYFIDLDYEVKFPTRLELDINNSPEDLPFKKGDFIIDLVPPPYVRDSSDLTSTDYHHIYTSPHLKFISQAIKKNIGKYIFVSSGGSIYGRSSNRIPFRESDIPKPISFYGESKLLQENHLLNETKNTSCLTVILRPSNIYNKNFQHPLQKGLVGSFVRKYSIKEPLEIYGDTLITKDYISNQDVAKAILKSIYHERSDIFNIGYGKTFSIQEIISAFDQKFNYHAEIIYKPFNQQDLEWFALNISNAKTELHFQAADDLINCIASSTIRQS